MRKWITRLEDDDLIGPEDQDDALVRLDAWLDAMRGTFHPATGHAADDSDLSGDELRLADLVAAIRAIPKPSPSAAFRQTTRRQLLSQPIPSHWNRSLVGAVRRDWRLIPAVIAALVVLAISGPAIVAFLFLGPILPSSPAYTTQRGVEQFVLLLAPNEETRVRFHADLARRRLDEAEALADAGESELAEQVAGDYCSEVSSAYTSLRLMPGRQLVPLARRMVSDLEQQQLELRTRLERAPSGSRQALQRALAGSYEITAQVGVITPAP